MKETNEIILKTIDDVIILDIKGDITAFSENKLIECYNIATKDGAKRLLFKLAPESYINSGGIAVLIQILSQTKLNSQFVGITGITEHFIKIFSMVGITKFATIYPNLDDALKKMASSL